MASAVRDRHPSNRPAYCASSAVWKAATVPTGQGVYGAGEGIRNPASCVGNEVYNPVHTRVFGWCGWICTSYLRLIGPALIHMSFTPSSWSGWVDLHHRPPSSRLGRLTTDLHPEYGASGRTCTDGFNALQAPAFAALPRMRCWSERVDSHYLTGDSRSPTSAASASPTNWCLGWESNPQNTVSETAVFANLTTKA
jgi:hypothetical protein